MDLADAGFQLPEKIYFEDDSLSDTYGKLIVEPLERGFGVTLGNSLRRVLLSSIKGAAITAIKIENINHEFTYIKGVKEDIVEIVMNLKKIRFKMYTDEEVIAHIDVQGKDKVLASDINGGSLLTPLNGDQPIVMLDREGSFKAELRVKKGRGYIPAEDIDKSDLPLGTITIDALFSPIRKVFFNVIKTRVGKPTDYDKLILEVWTDGSLSPADTIKRATHILMGHFAFFDLKEDNMYKPEKGKGPVTEETKDDTVEVDYESMAPVEFMAEQKEDFNKNLLKAVDELELSVRSHNCLKNADIKYIYELVQKSEHEMLKTKNFGRKSLNELKELLNSMGLDFDMKLDINALKNELLTKNGGLNET